MSAAGRAVWEADKATYEIGGFTLDVGRWQLRDPRGERVELPPLPFRLLLFLVEQRERVVSKEELFEVVWGDAVVNEGSLTQAISIVRRAFSGGEVGARVIENVRGRGYRCAARVERVEGRGAARESSDVSEQSSELEVPLEPRAGDSYLRLKPPREVESGRSAELGRLSQTLDTACGGRGAAVLISGAVGIGKTWLAGQALERAVARGAFPCELHGYEDQAAPPLFPLRKLAVLLVRRHTGPGSRLLLEQLGELRVLAPELAELLPVSANAPMRTAAEQRFFLFSALIDLLEQASREQPLIVLLEDLHWMDEATLRFLERLAPELPRMALTLVCTYRYASSPPLERVLAALGREATTLSLPLSGLDAAAARLLFCQHGVPSPEPQLVERALLLTEGNPLFLTQVARLISELPNSGAELDPETLALPEESRAVLRQQLSALPETTQHCLELAALLGDDFHLAELKQACRLPQDALLRELEPAFTTRLLTREAQPGFRRRFGHPSVRSAIYESIPEPRRMQLHAVIAEALLGMASDTRPRLSAIAHHLYECAPLGDVATAAHYGVLAARAAFAATAYEDTIAHCRRILPMVELGGHERARYDAHRLLGDALRCMKGAPEAVGEAYLAASESARRLSDGVLHAEAAMCFAGRAPWGITLLRAIGIVEPRELALLEESLTLLPEHAWATRARVQGWLAFALYNSDQSERKAALAHASVALARESGDAAALVECLMVAQLSLRSPESLHARIAGLRETAQLAHAAGLRTFQIDAMEELAWLLFEAGDATGAELEMQRVMRLAEELGRPQDRRKMARFRSMLLDAAGKLAESEALMEAVRTQTAWPPEHPENTAIRTMMVARLRGQSERSIAELEALSTRFPLPVAWHCGLITAYVATGRLDDARRELARLRPDQFVAIPDDHNRVSSYTNLAVACSQIGDLGACAILRDKLEPYAGRNVLLGIRGFYYGPVWRVLGMLDLALGDSERARERLTLAIARDQEMGTAISEAGGRLLYAEAELALAAPGFRARAEEQIEAATRLIGQMNIVPLELQLKRLRASLAGLPSAHDESTMRKR